MNAVMNLSSHRAFRVRAEGRSWSMTRTGLHERSVTKDRLWFSWIWSLCFAQGRKCRQGSREVQ